MTLLQDLQHQLSTFKRDLETNPLEAGKKFTLGTLGTLFILMPALPYLSPSVSFIILTSLSGGISSLISKHHENASRSKLKRMLLGYLIFNSFILNFFKPNNSFAKIFQELIPCIILAKLALNVHHKQNHTQLPFLIAFSANFLTQRNKTSFSKLFLSYGYGYFSAACGAEISNIVAESYKDYSGIHLTQAQCDQVNRLRS